MEKGLVNPFCRGEAIEFVFTWEGLLRVFVSFDSVIETCKGFNRASVSLAISDISVLAEEPLL